MTDTTIDGLSAASTLDGTEVLPAVVGGVTKKVTTELLAGAVSKASAMTFRGVNTATGTSPAPSVPTGTVAGDFCLYLCSTGNCDAAAGGPEGSGWTLIKRLNPSTGENIYAYYKVSLGSEGSTWALSTSNTAGSPNTAAALVASWGGGELHDVLWREKFHYITGPEAAAGGVAMYCFLSCLTISADATAPPNVSNFTVARDSAIMVSMGWRTTPFGGDSGDVSAGKGIQSTSGTATLAISLRPT